MNTPLKTNRQLASKAVEWETRKPPERYEPKVSTRHTWKQAIPLFVLGGVCVTVLPRKNHELPRFVFQSGANGHWITNAQAVKDREPWERAKPQKPYRREMTEYEFRLCSLIAKLLPLVSADLDTDPRTSQDVRTLRDRLKTCDWVQLRKPLGCAGILSALGAEPSSMPNTFEAIPPNWRQLPDHDLKHRFLAQQLRPAIFYLRANEKSALS